MSEEGREKRVVKLRRDCERLEIHTSRISVHTAGSYQSWGHNPNEHHYGATRQALQAPRVMMTMHGQTGGFGAVEFRSDLKRLIRKRITPAEVDLSNERGRLGSQAYPT